MEIQLTVAIVQQCLSKYTDTEIKTILMQVKTSLQSFSIEELIGILDKQAFLAEEAMTTNRDATGTFAVQDRMRTINIGLNDASQIYTISVIGLVITLMHDYILYMSSPTRRFMWKYSKYIPVLDVVSERLKPGFDYWLEAQVNKVNRDSGNDTSINAALKGATEFLKKSEEAEVVDNIDRVITNKW